MLAWLTRRSPDLCREDDPEMLCTLREAQSKFTSADSVWFFFGSALANEAYEMLGGERTDLASVRPLPLCASHMH